MSSSGYIASGLTATGTTQATALQLASNAYLNQVATITATNNGVLLPTNPVSGQICKVRNNNVSGINVSVYPQVGGLINSIGLNLPYVIPSSCVAEFISVSTLNWSTTSSSSDQGVVIPAGVTAHATGGQANALVIDTEQLYTLVSTCATILDSVALPRLPIINKPYFIMNTGVAACAIYPGNTGADNSSINNFANNAYMLLGTDQSCSFIAVSNTAGAIQWFTQGLTGPKAIIPMASATTRALTPAESGSLITINKTTGFNIPLPAVASGLIYEFVVYVTANAAVTIGTVAGANINVACLDGTPALVAGRLQSLVNFAAVAGNTVGDYIRVICNGTVWEASGQSVVAAGITVTA